MSIEKERQFLEAAHEYVDVLRHSSGALQLYGFLLSALASWCERLTRETLAQFGIQEWGITSYLHSSSLKLLTFFPRHLASDIGNGILGLIGFSGGPFVAFLVFMVGVFLLRRVALGWVVYRLDLQPTIWPNLDLVLWPFLAGVTQWIFMEWMLGRMDQSRRWAAMAWRIRNAENYAGAAGLIFFFASTLLPHVGFVACAWLQVFLVWVFQR